MQFSHDAQGPKKKRGAKSVTEPVIRRVGNQHRANPLEDQQ